MIATDYCVDIQKQYRKSISIECLPNLIVKVRTPFFMSVKQIEAFIFAKRHWIKKKMSYFTNNQTMIFPEYLGSDVTLYFLGKFYTLMLIELKKRLIYIDQDNLCVSFPYLKNQLKLKKFVLSWYQEQAYCICYDRVQFWTKQLNVKFKSFKVKKLKSRWGSCSSQDVITINWLLIK